MKKVLSLLLICFFSTQLWAQVTIIESAGWLESAYVKWTSEADSFNVYYSGEGITDKKIDTQLIREYKTYYRADVLGLKAGTYTLKIVPVSADNVEGTATSTPVLTVAAHDRSGFAHASNSPKGTASGAYNDDGTLRTSAQVVYVAAENAQSLDIYTNLLKPREKIKDNSATPLCIRFIGTIKQSEMPGINSAGLLQLKGSDAAHEQRVTFEGVGDDAYLEFGFDIVRTSNVEIRNLGFKNFQEDGVSIQSNNTNFWLHNCDFFYGQNKGGDKKKGDGASDVKDSQWGTVSYNHYWDSGKANLFGNSDDTIDYITYHHNYLDHSDSRHPRVRCAQNMHVYNNYYRGVGKYGVGAARKSSIFVESNYFENSKNPMLSSKQGTDILDGDGSGTFSGEDGGIIKAHNNKIEGLKGNYRPWTATGQQKTEFDAYEVENRTDLVPTDGSVIGKQGGHIYSNFDQNLAYNEFNLQTPDEAKANVIKYAGRVNGGDMKCTFGTEDYKKTDDPDPAVEAMIAAHVCGVVSIQGIGNAYGEGGGNGEGEGGGSIPEGGMTHNFTTQGTTSSFFTITGSNPSNSKGTVTYGGLTLTHCLKMETKTSITFTTEKNATLTLLFNNAGKTVSINGDAKTPDSNGLVTLEIEAGEHEIKRGNGEAYLYYISVVYPSTSTVVPVSEQIKFTLYPNPVANTLHIASESEIETVEIYNLTGAMVRNVQGNISTIAVSDLNAGSYIVKIQTCKGINGRMILKK